MADEAWPAYGTSEEKEYRFSPIEGKTLRFKVKVPHDCHLAFTAVPEDTEEMFEVFIGAWKGEASAIRFRKSDDLVKVDTPDILNGDEIKEFWVTFDDDLVRVGEGENHVPFMEGTLPEHIEVAYFGYSSGYGAIGWFQFHHEHTVHTEDCLDYNYKPIYGNSLVFNVSCGNDAHIALTNGAGDTEQMYEIFIGGWTNQKSAIRLDKDKEKTVVEVETPDIVCCDEGRSFYVSFKQGHIKVGQVGNPEPFISYLHTDPYEITHFGYCTGWGASGNWRFDI